MFSFAKRKLLAVAVAAGGQLRPILGAVSVPPPLLFRRHFLGTVDIANLDAASREHYRADSTSAAALAAQTPLAALQQRAGLAVLSSGQDHQDHDNSPTLKRRNRERVARRLQEEVVAWSQRRQLACGVFPDCAGVMQGQREHLQQQLANPGAASDLSLRPGAPVLAPPQGTAAFDAWIERLAVDKRWLREKGLLGDEFVREEIARAKAGWRGFTKNVERALQRLCEMQERRREREADRRRRGWGDAVEAEADMGDESGSAGRGGVGREGGESRLLAGWASSPSERVYAQLPRRP